MSARPERAAGTRAAEALVSRYAPLAGIPDELVDAQGRMRPVWRGFMEAFAAMTADERAERAQRGEQYLRDAGVFYRYYDAQNPTEREWPFSPVPVLIHEAEWAGIEAGLIQRADVLEALARDVYGENRLVADGVLPPEIVAGSPEWLRPMVGVRPPDGNFLHFIAFDVGRGPQGQWWVLGDRTQAPSGAGFALENRVATTRAYADIYGRSNVRRLAGFFRAFRDAMNGLRADTSSRVGILTPGPLNETYFEHAYIARYLGFALLEGEDLTVEGDALMVRTVAGLQPVHVLWRRLDAQWADPLELEASSRLGTPGLMAAVRAGRVHLVNALGSGFLETRALQAFMPEIARRVTGRPLLMPNIATWWCGDDAARATVEANGGRMMISGAFSTLPPFERDSASHPSGVTPHDLMRRDPAGLVGQEIVTLSTTPALFGGELVARPMSLRVFLARTPQGWQVMPGGFARVGRDSDPTAIAMQRGGSVADVWIVSDAKVQHETLLQSTVGRYERAQPGLLPSRAADNLFWLGRYVERAEHMMRVLRARQMRIAETGDDSAPLGEALAAYLATFGVDPGQPIPDALASTLDAAMASASHVRDRFSVDGWLALKDLARTLAKLQQTARAGDDAARALGVLLRKVSGFSGLVHENMYRFTGWRFLSIGRALERGILMSRVLSQFAAPDSAEGGFDLAVEIGDSAMTHRRRYAVATSRETVIDLLALDALNPRSIAYQLNEIDTHLRFLPGFEAGLAGMAKEGALRGPLAIMQAILSEEAPEAVDSARLALLGRVIAQLSDHVGQVYFR
ncbi:MAG: circularly permuted type 2 ATP-grasp protein [Rhizobiaceae bacterium]|jgi:uncharacterized circularly permuted ATP-grasp superfamily protein/uncharacterized alpha-E superfamily protein|nr:circularly permuted type 2 ATP-grasp protein [Rhizobiaceae bacterium]